MKFEKIVKSRQEIQSEFEEKFAVWNNKWVFATRPKEKNTTTTEDVLTFLFSTLDETIVGLVGEEEECGRKGQALSCAAYSGMCHHDGYNVLHSQILSKAKEKGLIK